MVFIEVTDTMLSHIVHSSLQSITFRERNHDGQRGLYVQWVP